MRIIYTNTVVKDAKKIKDKNTIDKITSVIQKLKEAETLAEIPNIKKLKKSSIAYRVRIGDYRLGLYQYTKNEVELIRLLKRNDIYKVFP